MQKSFITILTIIFVLLITGCSDSVSPDISIPDNPDLTINIISPDINSITSYLISGSGPDGSSFNEAAVNITISEDSLAEGSWSIIVTALDDGANSIGSGSGNIIIQPGIGQNLSVTVDIPLLFVTKWKTDNTGSGSSLDNQISLPLVWLASGEAYFDCTVDWGDNSQTTYSSSNQLEIESFPTTHTYSAIGTYEIIIEGDMRGFVFGGTGDIYKLIEISNWGPFTFEGDSGYFQGCSNLTIGALDIPDLSYITCLDQAFSGCSSLTCIPSIGNWDISAITSMDQMFSGVTLSTSNYSSLLIGWEDQSVKNSVIYDGGSSKYSPGAASDARSRLVNNHSWTVTDGGIN